MRAGEVVSGSVPDSPVTGDDATVRRLRRIIDVQRVIASAPYGDSKRSLNNAVDSASGDLEQFGDLGGGVLSSLI